MESSVQVDEVRIFSPASVGNVACGFDVLGLALEQPGDEIVARWVDEPGLRIDAITGDEGRLPTAAGLNTASIAAGALLDHLGLEAGVALEVHKRMPLGSGLGSSAASAVGGAVAVNELMGAPLTTRELLPFTLEGERITSGAAHADNVAAALLGGIVLARGPDATDVVSLNVPADLMCTILHPHVESKTGDMRRMLPDEVPLSSAVIQWGNLGGLVAGLYESDYALIGRSLQDVIIEPVRSALFPWLDSVKRAAREAGALGCSISGSGPAIFALSEGRATAVAARDAMKQAMVERGLECSAFVSPINQKGARVLQETE